MTFNAGKVQIKYSDPYASRYTMWCGTLNAGSYGIDATAKVSLPSQFYATSVGVDWVQSVYVNAQRHKSGFAANAGWQQWVDTGADGEQPSFLNETEFLDSPSDTPDSGYDAISDNDSFQVWILFLPPGLSSQWVSLKTFNWNFYGYASFSGRVLTLNAHTDRVSQLHKFRPTNQHGTTLLVPKTPPTLMNKVIQLQRLDKVILVSILVIILLITFTLICDAIDPQKHQIDIRTWGATANAMQLGFGVDKKELNDSAAQYVTVEFVIKNTSATHRTLVELGSHKGIFFFAKGADDSKHEMLGVIPSRGLSIFIHNISPGSNLKVYLRLKKADLLSLIASSAWAEATIREGESIAASPIAPFTIQVAIVIPR